MIRCIQEFSLGEVIDMDPVMEEIKGKMEDYSRFIVTLIILSFYLYIGTVINTFVYQSSQAIILVFLTIVSLSAAMVFVLKWKKYQQILLKSEE